MPYGYGLADWLCTADILWLISSHMLKPAYPYEALKGHWSWVHPGNVCCWVNSVAVSTPGGSWSGLEWSGVRHWAVKWLAQPWQKELRRAIWSGWWRVPGEVLFRTTGPCRWTLTTGRPWIMCVCVGGGGLLHSLADTLQWLWSFLGSGDLYLASPKCVCGQFWK